MTDLELLALRALLGGLGVVAFSLVSQLFKPKEFAGLFAASPAVALASLLLTSLSKGWHPAATNARGMIAGALGMVAFCVVGTFTVGRLHARLGSLAAAPAWVVVAVAGLLVLSH